jgi:hypothetical protein
MKLNRESQSRIEAAINNAINKYKNDCERMGITDIYIQPNQSSGEIFIFDDEDKELANTTIEEWAGYKGENFYENTERVLRNILAGMKESGMLKNLAIITPYSFVLVDEDKETISELMLIDDDMILLNDNELLKGLGKELESFLKNLMQD